jgi:hypothetical protein
MRRGGATCPWCRRGVETRGKRQEEGDESPGGARRRGGRASPVCDVSLERASWGCQNRGERGTGCPRVVYVACDVACEVFGASE